MQRHHLLARDPDGRTVQDVTFFELKPPPEPDPQTAGERVPYGLILAFLAWKRSQGGMAVLLRRASKAPGRGATALVGGDDGYGDANRRRQLIEMGFGHLA